MTLTKEFIVGLFVIAALAILTVVTVSLHNWDIFSHRYTYYVLFKQVKKLDVGAPVLVYGVQAGQVSNLEYYGAQNKQYPVLVTMRLDKSVELFPNATVRVVPAQVIGDTTINVETGTAQNGPRMKDGATIFGATTPELEETVNRVSDEMINALHGASIILNDPGNQAAFKETMLNTAELTGRMNETFEIINNQIMPVLNDLKKTANSMSAFLDNAQTLTNDVKGDVSRTGQSVRDTAADYGKAAATLNREIEEVSGRLKATIEQMQKTIQANQQPLNETLRELGETSKALGEVLDRIRKGEGTLGKLINDPRPFEQLRQILSGLSQTLTGQREAAFPTGLPSPGRPTPAPERTHP